MRDHVKIIGILNLVGAASLMMVAAQFLLVSVLFFDGGGPPLMRIGPVLFAIEAVPFLLAGIGLVRRRRWARVLAYITATLSLIAVPIGTAFGIYTFRVLRRPEVVATLT